MMRIDPKFCQGPGRRAATAVEFVVLLPVLMTLVLGCVDFGRFAYSYIVVTNAARAGASFATVNPYTPETFALWQSGIQGAVTQEMAGVNQFNAQALTVQTTVIVNADQSWSAQVAVSYPFQTLISWPGIPSSLNLQQTAVMESIRP